MKKNVLMGLFTVFLGACGGGDSSTTKDTDAIPVKFVDENVSLITISVLESDKFESLELGIYRDTDNAAYSLANLKGLITFEATIGDSYVIRTKNYKSDSFKCHFVMAQFTATDSPQTISIDPADFCFDRTPISDAIEKITDSNLRSCMQRSADFHTYSDEVGMIECDKPLTSLDGVENFRFITHLLLEDTGEDLTSISLELHDLWQFGIENSNVSSISLRSERLTHFAVERSPITTIPYSELKKIKSLDLRYLELSELNLIELPALERFKGFGLRMDALNISGMPYLTSVDLENTRSTHPGGIKNLSFDNNPNLQLIKSTNAERLTIGEGLHKLRSLYCDCPDLSFISIPPDNLEIEYLNVSSNQPLVFGVNLPQLTKLKSLSVSGFGIGYNFLDLSLLTELKKLYLADIVLGDLKLAPSGLLTDLRLDRNLLLTVPEGTAQALNADDDYLSVYFLSTVFKEPAQAEFDALKLTFTKGSFRLSFLQ